MFYKAVNTATVESLDGIGAVTDTVEKPLAYMVQTDKQWFGGTYAVALPRKDGFLLLDMTDGTAVDDLSFRTVDFNGTGSDELVVRWTSYRGHTGWENAIHERERFIRIWDLDSLVCSFDFMHYYSYQRWWTEYAPDSTNALPYDRREVLESGGELSCETYDVAVAARVVTIVQTNDCPDQGDDNEPEVLDPTFYRYKLTPNCLVLRK